VAKNSDPCFDFIVVFKPGLARTTSSDLLRQSSAQVKRTFTSVFNGALVNGPLSKMQALANNPNVLVVEDDLEVTTAAIQNVAPWGLDRIDQKLLPLSTTFDDKDQSGLNTYSYVVDTGIDATNLDFEGRVAAGFTAVLDGRGSADCNGHGTHVAGTIAGKTYGVAKKSTLIPVRVLDCAGSGSYSTVITGLDWIAANHRSGDAAVVNMSLGGPASSTLDGAVRNLIAKGINVVVAAGNSNADACNYSPARVIDAITVGATTDADVRANYSNIGSCLDLFAPGSSITSTWLGINGTQTISGTSMASPHVAGAVARFISLNPTLTPAQVAQSLRSSASRDLIQGAGTSSPNLLLHSEIVADSTTPVTDTSPTFRKVNPRGKVVGKG
jgi:subtilisin family serine protease